MNPKQTIENVMLSLFPENFEDDKIQRVRSILGNKASQISDEEISTSLTQFEFLITNWMDEFEKVIFDGKTLQEMLKL